MQVPCETVTAVQTHTILGTAQPRMDDFEDGGAGGGYERTIVIPIVSVDDVPRRIVVRERGRFARISVTLAERRAGQTGSLIRYDDAHGEFHRHAPSWPQPGPIIEILSHVPSRQRVAYARDEIRLRYTDWEADVFGAEAE